MIIHKREVGDHASDSKQDSETQPFSVLTHYKKKTRLVAFDLSWSSEILMGNSTEKPGRNVRSLQGKTTYGFRRLDDCGRIDEKKTEMGKDQEQQLHGTMDRR